MVRRMLLAALLAPALVAPATAAANPPDGDWTLVRKDAYKHYACKSPGKADTVKLRLATWFNGDDEAVGYGIGLYAAVARGSNKNLIAEKTLTNWENGYIRTTIKGVRTSDRLWMQGAYYGPAEPWSNGRRVTRITRCDPR
jgi:hypothetical protein